MEKVTFDIKFGPNFRRLSQKRTRQFCKQILFHQLLFKAAVEKNNFASQKSEKMSLNPGSTPGGTPPSAPQATPQTFVSTAPPTILQPEQSQPVNLATTSKPLLQQLQLHQQHQQTQQELQELQTFRRQVLEQQQAAAAAAAAAAGAAPAAAPTGAAPAAAVGVPAATPAPAASGHCFICGAQMLQRNWKRHLRSACPVDCTVNPNTDICTPPCSRVVHYWVHGARYP